MISPSERWMIEVSRVGVDGGRLEKNQDVEVSVGRISYQVLREDEEEKKYK